MQMIGVRELKDHLTQYLSMIKKGENVIVTDRGNPIAILHSLDQTEVTASQEEKLASLSKRGMVRLPSGRKKLDLDGLLLSAATNEGLEIMNPGKA